MQEMARIDQSLDLSGSGTDKFSGDVDEVDKSCMMDQPPSRNLQVPIAIPAAYTDISRLQIYAANNSNNQSSGSGNGDGNGNGVSNNININNNNNNNRSSSNGNPSEAEKVVRYRECQKNHAANLGSHALDGCGEFMADDDQGTAGALKCAACGCHRNFHRREVEGEEEGGGGGGSYEREVLLVSGASAPQMLMALRSAGLADSDDQDGLSRRGSANKRRFRTKFSQYQKERMYAFADRLGWRIQKHDEAAVQQFCSEVAVRRHVLKVWMHNNKHTFGKKA